MRKPRPTHVVIATPLGEHGRGGIDRVMDVIRAYARSHPDPAFALHFLTTRGKGSKLLSPLYFLSAVMRFVWLRATGRADLLHVNLVERGSTVRKLALCGLARWLSVPYVLHLHGAEFNHFWDSLPPPFSRLVTAAFNNAARTVVLGTFWARYISGRAPRARIEIVPNATFAPPSAIFSRPAQAPAQILFLGEMGPRKGVPELIQALAMLPKGDAWRATLAGNGAVKESAAEIARLGLDRNVTVRGWADPQEVDGLLRSADVLVLPSHHENLPMSVIEGMAYGLAVVTTPVGAVPDIIVPGETGLLCPAGDAAALAESLRILIYDPSLRQSLGRAARGFHRKHLDAPPFVTRLKAIWGEALSADRAPSQPARVA